MKVSHQETLDLLESAESVLLWISGQQSRLLPSEDGTPPGQILDGILSAITIHKDTISGRFKPQ